MLNYEDDYIDCPLYGRINIAKAMKERDEAIKREARELLPNYSTMETRLRYRESENEKVYDSGFGRVSCG